MATAEPGAGRIARGRRGEARRRFESGVSFPELLALMAIVALVLMVSVTYAIGWLSRVESRGAAYTVQAFLQRTRMEAVSRNHPCRFTVDTATGRIRVLDLVDVANASDDIIVSDATLSSKVGFARPDFGSPVTLSWISGSIHGATFDSGGSLAAGAGFVSLLGGEGYLRVNVYDAGGTSVERWDGAAWVAP